MRSLVLVPTALRATRAARRLCDAEGGVLFGARVVTPDRLIPGLLASAGERRPVLTPLAERLLAMDVARELGGRLAADDPGSGVARALGALAAELREAEVAPPALREAADGLEGLARERLAEVARWLAAYEARLAALEVLDRAGALQVAAAAVGRGVRSEETRALDLLVLDGFVQVAPATWRLVAALAASARRTHARVPAFPERGDLDAAGPLLRQVEALHELTSRADVSVVLEHLAGERAPALSAALLRVAGGPGAASPPEAGALRAQPGAGEEGEAALVARTVAGWLAAGVAPDDLAIVAPAPSAAAPRLARHFREHGVPFAGGVGQPLADVPVVRLVREALAGASRPGREQLERLLGSGLVGAGLSPRRVAALLDRAGALEGRGDPVERLAAWVARLGAGARERGEGERLVDACGRVHRRLAPLAQAGNGREHAARLRALLDGGLRRRLAQGAPEDVARDLAALRRLDEAADDAATALVLVGAGKDPMPSSAWRALLGAAVEAASLPAADPAGGAVELWPLSDAPGLASRRVVACGLGRGSFPAPPSPEPLLRDPERHAVNRHLRRAALATGASRRGAAFHAAFSAMAAARESLLLTWPARGPEGGGGPPAPLVVEAVIAAGGAVEGVPAPEPALADAAAPADALRAAARLAREGAGDAVRGAFGEVRAELRSRLDGVLERGAVESHRAGALDRRAAAPFAGAVPAPDALAALPETWSPTDLESAARCPFRLFLERPCRLAPPDDAGVDLAPRDEGTLAHAVLERFVRSRLGRTARPLDDAPEALAALRAALEDVLAEAERAGRSGDPALWPAKRAAVAARLERVLVAESARAAEEALQPVLVEHRFGEADGAPPLVFRRGEEEVRVRGRIDRVDASDERLRVVDYKGGRTRAAAWRERLDPEAFGVTAFQLPLYLLAAMRALPGRARVEAGYVPLRSATRPDPFSTDPADPLLATDEAARLRATAEGARPLADAVLDAVAPLRAGRFPIAPRDCTGCALGAVCRAEGSEEEDA